MNENTEVSADLIAPGALEASAEPTGDATPPPVVTPPPAQPPAPAMSEEEIQRLVNQYVSQASPPEDDDDGEETVADYLKKEVARQVAEVTSKMQAQFVPAQAAIAGEQIVTTLRDKYNLTAEEQSELRSVLSEIDPAQRANILVHTKAQENLAALARGRAGMKNPPTPAPSTRTSTGLTYAPGVTEQEIKMYLAFQGKSALDANDIKSLKASGHIL